MRSPDRAMWSAGSHVADLAGVASESLSRCALSGRAFFFAYYFYAYFYGQNASRPGG